MSWLDYEGWVELDPAGKAFEVAARIDSILDHETPWGVRQIRAIEEFHDINTEGV